MKTYLLGAGSGIGGAELHTHGWAGGWIPDTYPNYKPIYDFLGWIEAIVRATIVRKWVSAGLFVPSVYT